MDAGQESIGLDMLAHLDAVCVRKWFQRRCSEALAKRSVNESEDIGISVFRVRFRYKQDLF